MKLSENPFYILRLPCTAGRREIVSAAEEMSFMLDSEACSNAQNELINLNKRLTSEINWFIDVDEATIAQIRTCIEEGSLIDISGLSPFSSLNAAIYNFSLSADADAAKLFEPVMDIDQRYAALNADELTACINKNRNVAQLSPIQAQDVLAELGKKRETIRQCIADKLAHLDQAAYVALVSQLAETLLPDSACNDGVIVSDVIDQYEIRIHADLEALTGAVENHIAKIMTLTDKALISQQVAPPINEVKQWDRVAQPIQIKSHASGIPHQISENLGSKLRNLSIFLHNEKGLTKEALTLVTAMKSVFAEIDILSDQFDTDTGVLGCVYTRKVI